MGGHEQITTKKNNNSIDGKQLCYRASTDSPTCEESQEHIDAEGEEWKPKEITVLDIIGNFGLYQFSLVLITFIRYISVAMMTNTGPLIAPDVEYSCILPEALLNITKSDLSVISQLKNGCQIKIPSSIIENNPNITSKVHLNDGTYNCLYWNYNTSLVGRTMTDEFNLVCDRDWLRSLFQSSVSIGVVLASVFWGTFSDKHGRCYSMRICFLVSLVSGSLSVVAPNFMIYALSRSVCSLGDLGLVVSLATTLVESVGNRYRGPSCIIVYLGWAIGVMIMPWVTDYFRDFRSLMLFTVFCHLATLPWLLVKKESVRWLLINGKFSEAQREIKRIARWNGWRTELDQEEVDRKTALLKARFDIDDDDDDTSHAWGDNIFPNPKVIPDPGGQQKQQTIDGNNHADIHCSYDLNKSDNNSLFGGFDKLRQLFESKELSTTTITLVWVTFNSELLYMSFILINSDVGEDLYLNYAIGGLMETLAALISALVISNVTRRLSLTSSLLCISLICFFLSFIYKDASLAVYLLSVAKLAISTLSSLIYVTATEMFPTDLRQTGSGACATFGSMGAVVAPFICSQLVNTIGMQYVLILFGVSSATAALLIPFFLRETKGVELADTLAEIEQR